MAKEDYTAALQALAMLTDTATTFKKMEFASAEGERAFDRQQEASELQFKRQAEFQKDTMMLQNSLQLERDAYNRYKTLMDEVAEYGITYNELESPNAQQIFKDMSSNEIREIGAIKSNFEKLQQFNMRLSNKIAEQKKLDLKDRRKIQELQKFKLEEELETSKLARFEKLEEQNFFILSSEVPTDMDEILKMKSGMAGVEGRQIYKSIVNMGSDELVAMAAGSDIDYLDEASGVPDVSDEEAWNNIFKAQALQYAKENRSFDFIKLSEDDINSGETGEPSAKYKAWEDKYLTIAKEGLKDNTAYTMKTRESLFTAKTEESKQLRERFAEEYTELSTAHTAMKDIIGTIDTEGNVSFRQGEKQLKKRAKKKFGWSEATTERLLYTVMNLPDSPLLARKLMRDNKQIEELLSLFDAGRTYQQYIVNLADKIDRSKLIKQEYQVSDETEDIMNLLNTKGQ